MIAALLIAALGCGFLVTYPYVVYPFLLRAFPSKQLLRDPENKLSATLVFCAYNESAAMGEKLANLDALKARHPDLEVLAFDDGSSDSTYSQLAARSDLVTVVRGGGRSGKANGMKQLAALAKGDIMIFTDANVLLKEDAIDNLRAWYADQSVGGICGKLQYLGADESATASVGGRYWRLEEWLKSEESRTGNVIGADGSIFSIRRELYPDFPDTVLDDLTVSMAVVFAGKRLIKADDVVAYEHLVAVRKEEFSRKVRISARAYHTHLYLRPQLAKMAPVDKFKYYSRKFVRWFGGLFLVIGAVSALVAALLVEPIAALVAVSSIGGLAFVGSMTSKGAFSALVEVVLALFATLIGVYRAMRGRTVVVWSPAKSR